MGGIPSRTGTVTGDRRSAPVFRSADCPYPQRVASLTRLEKFHAGRAGAAAASWDNSRSAEKTSRPRTGERASPFEHRCGRGRPHSAVNSCRRRGDETHFKSGVFSQSLLTSSPTISATSAFNRSAAVSRRPAAAMSAYRAVLNLPNASSPAKLLRLIPLRDTVALR